MIFQARGNRCGQPELENSLKKTSLRAESEAIHIYTCMFVYGLPRYARNDDIAALRQAQDKLAALLAMTYFLRALDYLFVPFFDVAD